MEELLAQIKNGKLCIHANIRFDKEEQKKLDAIFKEIDLDSNTDYLMKSDRYFFYREERNIWYGNEDKPTHIPSITLNELLTKI